MKLRRVAWTALIDRMRSGSKDDSYLIVCPSNCFKVDFIEHVWMFIEDVASRGRLVNNAENVAYGTTFRLSGLAMVTFSTNDPDACCGRSHSHVVLLGYYDDLEYLIPAIYGPIVEKWKAIHGVEGEIILV